MLQAVIQCAAAHLKASTDRPVGARRLLSHAVRHAFRLVAAHVASRAEELQVLENETI